MQTRREEKFQSHSHQTLTPNSVAAGFDMSRQAISKHIKILAECGLIVIRKRGSEHFCEAKFDKLSEVSVWVEQYRKSWESKFDSLEIYLDKLQKNKKHANRRK